MITEKTNVLWSCDDCGIGKNCSLRKIFNNFEKAFSELSNEIKKQKVSVNSSYADKLKMNNEPVLLIKPKIDEQTSGVTKEDVRKWIDPTEIEISGIKNVSRGGIMIECKNNQAISKLKHEAQLKLSEKYSINEPKKRSPRVKITGMRDKWSQEEILSKIKSQNKFINPSKCNIKIVHIAEMKAIKNRPIKYFAYAEVDAEAYRNLMEIKKINIGWDVCTVHDAVYVIRCYKCCGYNHKARDCKKVSRCPKCAGSHDLK